MTALTPAVFTSGIHEECLVFGPQHPDSLFDLGRTRKDDAAEPDFV